MRKTTIKFVKKAHMWCKTSWSEGTVKGKSELIQKIEWFSTKPTI